MPDNARRTGPALERMQGFIAWLVPTVEKFSRSQKFLLSDRIQSAALDVLERLIEATDTRARPRTRPQRREYPTRIGYAAPASGPSLTREGV